MLNYNIVLPSKPRITNEDGNIGVYEIDGLYPGYGHTLGNSLRRIILSSLPGAAITSVKIDGAEHEFSTVAGVKEDVIAIILNLKKVRLQILTEEPQILNLKAKGVKEVRAADIEVPGQVQILNPDQHIASLTTKNSELAMELHVKRGIGYIAKEILQKEKVEIGSITLDAVFSPIRRVNYEVENMRVGDRTDFNRIKIYIETDGTLKPREALRQAIEIMITQLKAIIGFKEEEQLRETEKMEEKSGESSETGEKTKSKKELDPEFLKTRIESIGLSARTTTALNNANIRTLGGLVRKKEEDILDVEGLGTKGAQEIKKVLADLGITLK